MNTAPSITRTRCYRYAIVPSAVQRVAIDSAARDARRFWNALVAAERYAEHEIEHGRRGSIQQKLTKILLGKKLTGVAAVKARERAQLDNVALDEAARRNRVDQAAKIAECVYAKDGRLLRQISTRRLAIAYALESVEATRKKKGGIGSQVAVALIGKFQDSCALYVSGKRGAPHFKRRGDSISLQYQVQASSPSPITDCTVRLDKLAGEVCTAVPVILHRPIPDGATIKQVALTIRGERLFAVLMLDIAGPGIQRPMTGQIAGIDPGRKVALSLSGLDGQTQELIQPSLSRDKRTLKRLRRMQRKAARQLRIANPECFNPDGTFKRGKRPQNKSANFIETGRQVLAIQEHIAAARLDFYHVTANRLLSEYDVIGIGTWRGNGSAPGLGKAKRAQTRKDYDHAISSFVAIAKYKAEESGKTVLAVPEHGTTKTCSSCGKATGPSGLADLKIRQWTCSSCGAEHDRDFQAARAIATRAQEMVAVSVDGVTSALKVRKKGRRAQKAQTQGLAQANQIPVAVAKDTEGCGYCDCQKRCRPIGGHSGCSGRGWPWVMRHS
jgi:transposase